jgi:Protein of unknown function (DUF664)
MAIVQRPAELLIGDERDILANLLDWHRATLLWKCEGPDEVRLRRRSVAPSGLSLFDLLRHLTGAERYWSQVCLDVAATSTRFTRRRLTARSMTVTRRRLRV